MIDIYFKVVYGLEEAAWHIAIFIEDRIKGFNGIGCIEYRGVLTSGLFKDISLVVNETELLDSFREAC